MCVSVLEKNWIRIGNKEKKQKIDVVINTRDEFKVFTVKESFAGKHSDDDDVAATMAT